MGAAQTNNMMKQGFVPEVSNSSNDQTCQNFDFNKFAFTCPNARNKNNMCACGKDCVMFEGTCCKNVVFDKKQQKYMCEELTQVPNSTPIALSKYGDCLVPREVAYNGNIIAGRNACRMAKGQDMITSLNDSILKPTGFLQ